MTCKILKIVWNCRASLSVSMASVIRGQIVRPGLILSVRRYRGADVLGRRQTLLLRASAFRVILAARPLSSVRVHISGRIPSRPRILWSRARTLSISLVDLWPECARPLILPYSRCCWRGVTRIFYTKAASTTRSSAIHPPVFGWCTPAFSS